MSETSATDAPATETEASDGTGADPELAVVLVGRYGLDTLRPILACLADQTAAARLQVIAVLPESADLSGFEGLFARLDQVAFGTIGNRGEAAAAGIRRARAPIVAMSENHCFPERDWAERLIAAGAEADDDVAGLAPAVLNANPTSALGWASYASGYAIFSPEKPGGDVAEMPLHNAAYRQSWLERYDNDLEALLADERRICRRIGADGGRLRFIPEIRTAHLNEASWPLALGISYCNGRRYAGRRGQGWPLWRRLAYALAFPLLAIPVARSARDRLATISNVPARGISGRLCTAAVSLASAFGEAVGYLRGPKDMFDFVDREEFMVTERVGRSRAATPEIARYLALATPLPRRGRPASASRR